MEAPYPPCCHIPCFKSLCETSGFCTRFGKIGVKWFDENRAKIMLSSAFLSFLAIVFCAVAVASLSPDANVIKNTNWTYGSSDGFEYFVGLNQIVIAPESGDQIEVEWADAQCTSDYCNECKDATSSSISTAIISLITCLPTLSTDIQRSTRAGDLNCQKFMALFTGIMGTITTLIALSSYSDGCFKNLPDSDSSGDVEWKLGPGFSLLLVATLLKPVNVIIHMLMPVVKEEDNQNLKSANSAL